jgi:hypothetical protein
MQFNRMFRFCLFLLLLCAQNLVATIQVKVFSFDDALNDPSNSNPRIYIQNLSGSEAISNFSYCYYFSAENNKIPILGDYYTPNSIPTLQNLGNGNYRIKFDFINITLQPGQILPNTSGEVVGIHYSDFSALDKTNDHSNNLSGAFALNPNIPVFLSNGTQIYGNLPSNPSQPLQPPPVYATSGDFSVFSKEYTDLRDRVLIRAGNVGSSVYTELGCNDTVYGTVLCKGTIFLRERARIEGNVTAGQTVNQQNSVVITGTLRNYAQMNLPKLTTPTISYGTTSVSVPANTNYTLIPGSYNIFHAFANVNLTIQAGNYSFKEFILEPNVKVAFAVNQGTRAELKIKDNCSLGNGTIMSLPAGSSSSYSVSFLSAQTTQFYIGTDAVIKGVIFAPDAEVHVYSRTTISGSLYGRRVIVEPDVKICKPPTLLHLANSESVMAPPFDPVIFNYKSVVSDATSVITIIPTIRTGQSVTVNGNPPSTPVNLNAGETSISVLVSHPEACGTTEYNLKVTRSPDYAIYVNDNSPCTPGSENGNSWATAYKILQPAIDRAIQEGKVIRIAEGVYKPTFRTVNTDPRSATFSIPCGVKIVGGFNGTETSSDPDPKGSGYATILTGDINSDDGSCSLWPPSGSDLQYVDDNAYHTITVDCNPNGTDISFNNLTVQGGYADGSGTNAKGAGIYVKSGKPQLEFVCIRNNVSTSDGAGMLVPESMGITLLRHCLFQNNVCVAGNGAGLAYFSSDRLTIDASIFDANKTQSSVSDIGGSALSFKGAIVEIVNSVFANNISNSILGAVLNNGGTLSSVNNTFAFNTGNGAVSNCNLNSGYSTVDNCILWNASGKNEVSGANFTIAYSDITNGFSGTGNFASNPLFVNATQTSGPNGKWGDYDDGLLLINSSPCRFKGIMYGAPDRDILGDIRESSGCFIDIGAYGYADIEPGNILGRIINGTYVPLANAPIVTGITKEEDINFSICNGYSRIIQVVVPKNDYTDAKNVITASIIGENSGGTPIGTALTISLYRVPSTQYFRSLIFDGGRQGKHVIFVDNPAMIGSYTYAYALLGQTTGRLQVSVPRSQFR